MAIHALLENSPFGAAEIKVMTDAHEECLRLLEITDRPGPLSELLAARVVLIFKTGVDDPMVIAAEAIKTIGIPLQQ